MNIETLKQGYALLPPAEREAFAAFVLAQREAGDTGFTEEEIAEFERRAEEAESGTVRLYSLEEVHEAISRKHGIEISLPR